MQGVIRSVNSRNVPYIKVAGNRKVHVGILLAGTSITSALVYWFAFVQAVPLKRWLNIPRLDSFFLYRNGVEILVHFVLAFFSLGVLYFLGYRLASYLQGRSAWFMVFFGSIVFGLLLLFMYPFDSSDLFDNIVHGRMVAETGDNPFTVPATAHRNDPFFKYMGWPKSPAAYGPLWEFVAGAAIKVSGDSKVGNLLAMKFVPGLFLLAGIAVVALILRKINPQAAPARTLLLAWNPVVLYETWGNGHNDMSMVLWILVAAWALMYKRYSLAILSLIVGTLFKYLPVLLVPAVGLIALHNIQRKDWLKFIILTSIGGLALIVISYWPFWEGLETLSITRRAGLYSSTLPAVIFHLLVPTLGKTIAGSVVSIPALVMTLGVAIWQAFKVRKQDSFNGFLSATFTIFMVYLLLTNLWFQQWYAIWVIALVPLIQPGFRTRLAQVFAFSVLSKQFLIGPAIFWQKVWPVQPWLEAGFTFGVLGISWLYVLFSASSSRIVRREQVEKLRPVALPRVIPTKAIPNRLGPAWPFAGKEAERIYHRYNE